MIQSQDLTLRLIQIMCTSIFFYVNIFIISQKKTVIKKYLNNKGNTGIMKKRCHFELWGGHLENGQNLNGQLYYSSNVPEPSCKIHQVKYLFYTICYTITNDKSIHWYFCVQGSYSKDLYSYLNNACWNAGISLQCYTIQVKNIKQTINDSFE